MKQQIDVITFAFDTDLRKIHHIDLQGVECVNGARSQHLDEKFFEKSVAKSMFAARIEQEAQEIRMPQLLMNDVQRFKQIVFGREIFKLFDLWIKDEGFKT